MTLWIFLTVLTAASAILVTLPFMRQNDGTGQRGPSSLDVYEDQLEEVEKERQMGLLEESESTMARLEIERRILDAGKSDTGLATGIGHAWQTRTLVVVSSFVIVGSVGLYAAIGSPQLASQAVAQSHQAAAPATQTAQTAQTASPADGLSDVDQMIKNLEEKVKDNPQDVEGLRVLGWSYYNMGRFAEAAETYRKASELKTDNAELKSLYGEALVRVSNGVVSQKAVDAFKATIAMDPKDVRAQYFIGLSMKQKGDFKGAVDTWVALYKESPPEAKWAMELRREIEATAKSAEIDIKGALPEGVAAASQTLPKPSGNGPTEEDIKNSQSMPADDRMEMVRGMVDGLATRLKETPEDPDGWVQLMRSRMVLKEPDAARQAFADAMKTFADKPQIQVFLISAAEQMGIDVK